MTAVDRMQLERLRQTLDEREARIRELEAEKSDLVAGLENIRDTCDGNAHGIASATLDLVPHTPAPPDSEPAESSGGDEQHQWDRGGERCVKCGAKDWMDAPCTPPEQRDALEAFDRILNEHRCGDPAYGVDVEKVRRALREPRLPDGETIETIRDAICLLEQSAGPFDEACRILRAAAPEPDSGEDA